jgi:DNA-binding NarL/FixJ family response regulator
MSSKAIRPARILLVDDHPVVREGLSTRLATYTDLEVCGEASDVPEALRLVAELHPDLVIVDITLKNSNGLDLIKQIKYQFEQVRMLVWSMHSESLYAERSLRAGALGYINKQQATDKIIDAIRRVLEGKVYLSDEMTDRILQRNVGATLQSERSPIEKLADRELEVFRLIGQGFKTADIAQQLHLSVKTIETYRDRIRQKLDLCDGRQLTKTAIEWVLRSECV